MVIGSQIFAKLHDAPYEQCLCSGAICIQFWKVHTGSSDSTCQLRNVLVSDEQSRNSKLKIRTLNSTISQPEAKRTKGENDAS